MGACRRFPMTASPNACRASRAGHVRATRSSRPSSSRRFPDAITFVTRIAELAEAADHHPDIDIRYRKVRIALSTHDAGGLTQRLRSRGRDRGLPASDDLRDRRHRRSWCLLCSRWSSRSPRTGARPRRRRGRLRDGLGPPRLRRRSGRSRVRSCATASTGAGFVAAKRAAYDHQRRARRPVPTHDRGSIRS